MKFALIALALLLAGCGDNGNVVDPQNNSQADVLSIAVQSSSSEETVVVLSSGEVPQSSEEASSSAMVYGTLLKKVKKISEDVASVVPPPLPPENLSSAFTGGSSGSGTSHGVVTVMDRYYTVLEGYYPPDSLALDCSAMMVVMQRRSSETDTTISIRGTFDCIDEEGNREDYVVYNAFDEVTQVDSGTTEDGGKYYIFTGREPANTWPEYNRVTFQWFGELTSAVGMFTYWYDTCIVNDMDLCTLDEQGERTVIPKFKFIE